MLSNIVVYIRSSNDLRQKESEQSLVEKIVTWLAYSRTQNKPGCSTIRPFLTHLR